MVTGTMISPSLRAYHKLKESDEDIKTLWSSQHPLKPFLAPE